MNGRPRVPGYPDTAPPTFQRWPLDKGDGRYEKLLLIAPGGALTEDLTVPFRVTTPFGVKCVVRLTVFVDVPDDNGADPLADDYTDQYAAGARLWLASIPKLGRGRTKRIPTREIVPTRGAGLIIPTSPALWGYEVITQTLGDEIHGELTVNALEDDVSNAPEEGVNWCVRVDYESAVPCSADEWASLVQKVGVFATAKRMA